MRRLHEFLALLLPDCFDAHTAPRGDSQRNHRRRGVRSQVALQESSPTFKPTKKLLLRGRIEKIDATESALAFVTLTLVGGDLCRGDHAPRTRRVAADRRADVFALVNLVALDERGL